MQAGCYHKNVTNIANMSDYIDICNLVNERIHTAMNYKIERVSVISRQNRPNHYPLADMAPGESFYVERAEVPKVRSAATSFHRSKQNRDRKRFTVCADERGGARCVRIK